ncbi:MAG: hypothetical protein ABI162_12575 [Luteolibacter sp.]
MKNDAAEGLGFRAWDSEEIHSLSDPEGLNYYFRIFSLRAEGDCPKRSEYSDASVQTQSRRGVDPAFGGVQMVEEVVLI